MTSLKRFLNPKNDIAFKKIFGTEENADVVIAVLNAVLEKQLRKPITSITFLNPVQEPEILAKKQSAVDVLCRDKDGCQYVIEMQVANTQGFEERAQYYAFKAFTSQMKKGDAYYDLKEVIFLAFCDFPIFAQKEHYKSEHVTLDKYTGEHDLDKISFTFVDLVKFEEQLKKPIHKLTFEEKIYYFLRCTPYMSDGELEILMKDNSILTKMFQTLAQYHWTEQELLQYEQEQKRAWDNKAIIEKAIEDGTKRGIEQGIEQGKVRSIQELLRKGWITEENAKEALSGM